MSAVKRETDTARKAAPGAMATAAPIAATLETRCFPLPGSDEAGGSAVSLNIGISAMRSQTSTPPAPDAHGGYTA